MFKLKYLRKQSFRDDFLGPAGLQTPPSEKSQHAPFKSVRIISSEEKRPSLKQAKASSWQLLVDNPCNMTMSYMNIEKSREKRISQCEHSSPAKRPKTTARTTTSLATKPYPDFNFRHKFSLLVVGPTQS